MTSIEPFRLAVPEEQLVDLRRRLDSTRWPEAETVSDWSQGVPLAQAQALCGYWRDEYDWRRCEAMLNGFGQHRALVDGLRIHFLHIRSPEPNALPLLMTHGWPGSVIEFHKVIRPLTDPRAHGASGADAFHLILPSLPGYGFSDKPSESGWGVKRIAAGWANLMQQIGYRRYVAQGGDWGAAVATALGALAPPELAAIHVNMPLAFPDASDTAGWTEEEQAAAAAFSRFTEEESGYSAQQRTRPQTLGYGLTDSPAGQAAWILEKFRAWSDCGGDALALFSPDELLDNIMLYWLPAAATSSARLYWESMPGAFVPEPVEVPTGISIFPKELLTPSRRWANRTYQNIVHWNRLGEGGHFPAFEQPAAFVDELRTCFRPFRQS